MGIYGDIKYPYALNGDHDPVHIKDAVRGRSYHCPYCNGRMFPRKGEIVKHHFYHNDEDGVSCNGESALHIIAKKLIYKRINRCLDSGNDITIEWKCHDPCCSAVHKGRLLKKTKRVEVERKIKGIIPDLSLIDGNDDLFAGIEIFVHNRVSEDKRRLYNNIGAFVIEIRICDWSDLSFIEDDMWGIRPKIDYDYCPHTLRSIRGKLGEQKRICSICGTKKVERYYHLYKVKCCNTECGGIFNIVVNDKNKYPKDYDLYAKDIINEHNILIREVDDPYGVHTVCLCPHCMHEYHFISTLHKWYYEVEKKKMMPHRGFCLCHVKESRRERVKRKRYVMRVSRWHSMELFYDIEDKGNAFLDKNGL